MTSPGQLRIEVLCEDTEHETFARRFFERWHGIDRRRVRVTKAPKGQGAASQWVAAQFADFARRARASNYQRRLGFLVIIDGDNLGSDGRKRDLEGHALRDPDVRIAIWAPTWEVETWVLWLTQTTVDGHQVHEKQSFKSALSGDRFRDLVEAAVEAWKTPLPGEANAVPSLADARSELTRIV